MKISLKKLLCACVLLMLPITFFQVFQFQLSYSKPPSPVIESDLPKTTEETYSVNCSLNFYDRNVLENLFPSIKNMNSQRIVKLREKLSHACRGGSSQSTAKDESRQMKAHLRPVPVENHFLVHSPRKALDEASKIKSNFPMCPAVSPLLKGHIDVKISYEQELKNEDEKFFNWPMTFEEIASVYPDIRLGGFYPGPKNCKCRSFNAVIVPYRNREEHLKYFLYYIHQILQRQQLCYVVIVAEQADNKVFNKGQLMNTAFHYAKETSNFDCYIFHDVDIIAQDDRILYACRDDFIVHFAPYIDKFKYKFNPVITVGAAVGYTPEQYLKLNGYSNEFAGWGGEDDDMMARIKAKGLKVWRSQQDYTKWLHPTPPVQPGQMNHERPNLEKHENS